MTLGSSFLICDVGFIIFPDEDEVREYESFKRYLDAVKSRQQQKADKSGEDKT